MEKDKISIHYKENEKLYARLAENIKQALLTFLNENKISFHTISSRIKEFNSFYEKIERKGYENPIEQIEDFCGIRIICFYPSDLDEIGKIISKEFEILESIDKTSKLEPDRFGYRSNHYIVKIKKEWLKAPNYRGLENLKTEIQVRTILMHSWADIEHKLAYKKKEQIPEKFRRKLNQLSALLEIADSQFQELKNEKEEFKKSLFIGNDKEQKFDITQEMNLDSFQAYLDFSFPENRKDLASTRILFDEINLLGITLQEFDLMKNKANPYLDDLEKKIVKVGKWAQVGIARIILDLISDEYWNNRGESWRKTDWAKNIIETRKKIK